MSPVSRVWDRPRPFYGCGVCACTYTHTRDGVGERNDDDDDDDDGSSRRCTLYFHHRKGATVAVQPRLPRRYLLRGGRGRAIYYIILFLLPILRGP